MSLTRPQARAKLFLRIDGLGGARVALDREVDGIIDPTPFARNTQGPTAYQGSLIYTPNDAPADQVREAGVVDGPKLFQTGDPWINFSDLNYELYWQLHPYVVNECLRRALHMVYGEVTVPLTLWPDGDLTADNVDSWSEGPLTPTKSSDSVFKFIGNPRTLVVLTAGSDLYAQSKSARVEPLDRIFHAAIGNLDDDSSGSCYYALWDVDNNVAIFETTFESYRDQIIRRTDTVPNDCRHIAIRVGATASGVTTLWKAFPSHFLGRGTTDTQSWLQEQQNLLGFGPAHYRSTTGDSRFNAHDRTWTEWDDRNGKDFQLMPFVPASSSYSLQITHPGGLSANDFWFHGYRRMSDIQEEMDNEAASTDANEDYYLYACEQLVCELLGPEYQGQAQKAEQNLMFQRIARGLIQPTHEQTTTMLGMRRGRTRWHD